MSLFSICNPNLRCLALTIPKYFSVPFVYDIPSNICSISLGSSMIVETGCELFNSSKPNRPKKSATKIMLNAFHSGNSYTCDIAIKTRSIKYEIINCIYLCIQK